jgi:hypothetical protein
MGQFSLSPRRLTLACVAICRRHVNTDPGVASNGLRPIEVHLEAYHDDRRTTGHRGLFPAFPWCLSGCGKRFLVGGQTYIVIR